MTKRKTIYVASSFLAIVFLAVIFWRIGQGMSVNADSSGKLVDNQKINIVFDDKSENFNLQTYLLTDGSYQNFLIADRFWKISAIKLDGFEGDVHACSANVFKSSDIKNTICLSGIVGAHSENLELISWKNNQFGNISFVKDNISANNISSDVPDFKFTDYNHDGLFDIIVSQRNYDTDPLTQSIEEFYRGDKTEFIFDTVKNIN